MRVLTLEAAIGLLALCVGFFSLGYMMGFNAHKTQK